MAGAFQSDAFQSDTFQEDAGNSVSATDAPTTSDSAARLLTLLRTATDTPTTSDAVTRTGTFNRTTTDAPTLSDAATATIISATRTAADTLTLSSTAARIGSFTRTATDAPTTSDSAARAASLIRTAADSPTTSDAATVHSTATRTAADAPTIAGIATGQKTVSRTATDSLTTSDTATRTGSLSRSASDSVTIYDAAGRYLTPPPIVTGTTSVDPIVRYGIVITYDGTDITSSVVLADATFVSQVNSQPGPCSFRVRDPLRNKSFTTGKRLTLDIGGNRVWAGYVTAVKRVYPFADCAPATRFLQIEGTDINILFHKRFIENQSTPTKMLGPTYSAATKDYVTIAALVSGWLDLSGDDLNTGAYVENVGNVNVDQKANLWQAGWEWASGMATIARLTQAIWYIDPTRNLVYTDVDTPTAPYALTDTGSGAGYREMEIFHDGSQLVNDALIWGVGGGSPTPVFKRLTDATSVTTHGVWQEGATYGGAWKQATVDKIADSIVNGSPLSKRGGKNDRISVNLATHQGGFLPAQKVTFTSAAHGYTDVIPIRRMEVTFPAGHPKYRLTLSFEIDQPFNLIDLIPLPRVTGVGLGGGVGTTPIPIPGTSACDCGITDSFTRTVSGFGTSDSGIVWGTGGSGTSSVDGSRGVMTVGRWVTFDTPVSATGVEATFDLQLTVPTSYSFELSTSADAGTGNEVCDFYINANGIGGVGVNNIKVVRSPDTFFGSNDVASFPLGTGVIHVRFQIDDAGGRIKLWNDGDPEPGPWTVSSTTVSPDALDGQPIELFFRNAVGTATTYMDNFDIVGVDKCTEFRFDNFNRTVSGGWGTSDFGLSWSLPFGDGGATVGVGGGEGYAICGSNTGPLLRVSSASGPWTTVTGFTYTASFTASTVPAAGEDAQFSFFSDSGGVIITVSSDAGRGEVILGSDSVVKTDWAFGAIYLLKWEFTPGVVSRLKVWESSDPEPLSWLITESTITSTMNSDWNVGLNNDDHTGDITLSLNYINFDYDGKPCFQDCGGGGTGRATVDDFENRTISPGSQDWGAASYGPSWTSGTGAAPSDLYVDSGDGAIVASNQTTYVYQLAPQTGLRPNDTFGVMRIKFHVDVLPGPTHGDDFTIQAYNGQEQVNVVIDSDVGTGGVTVFCGTGGTGSSPSFGDFVDWSANVDYWLKWEYEGAISRATIWRDTDPEPVSWLASRSTSGDTPSPTSNFEIDWESVNTTFPHSTDTLFISDISITGCTDVSGGTGTDTYDIRFRKCMTLTTDGSTTLFTVDGGYAAGTLEVYLNGSRETYGVNYTETNPGGGMFTMTSAPAGVDELYVCYHYLEPGGSAGQNSSGRHLL